MFTIVNLLLPHPVCMHIYIFLNPSNRYFLYFVEKAQKTSLSQCLRARASRGITNPKLLPPTLCSALRHTMLPL